MTPSILRITLVIAILVGIGVVLNIFGNQQRMAAMRDGLQRPTAPQPAVRPKEVGVDEREAAARRIETAVRGQLRERGYLPRDDNDHSPVTLAAAILAFQFDHNLGLTAEPSEKFLKAMIFAQVQSAGRNPVRSETDTAKRFVSEVQRALAHLGYAESDITQHLDEPTRRAIRKFERARGLQVSGRISAPLIESLGPAFDPTRLKLAASAAAKGNPTLTVSSTNAR